MCRLIAIDSFGLHIFSFCQLSLCVAACKLAVFYLSNAISRYEALVAFVIEKVCFLARLKS